MRLCRVTLSLAPGEVDPLDEDELDRLLEGLCEDARLESACLLTDVPQNVVDVVIYIHSEYPIRDSIGALERVSDAHIASTQVEAWNVDEKDLPPAAGLPAPVRRGHRAVPHLAHMNDKERMVYTAVQVLNGHDKDATVKHIREYFAAQLETVASLIHEGTLERTLQALSDQGYVDVYLAEQPLSEDLLDTNDTRGV